MKLTVSKATGAPPPVAWRSSGRFVDTDFTLGEGGNNVFKTFYKDRTHARLVNNCISGSYACQTLCSHPGQKVQLVQYRYRRYSRCCQGWYSQCSPLGFWNNSSLELYRIKLFKFLNFIGKKFSSFELYRIKLFKFLNFIWKKFSSFELYRIKLFNFLIS